MRGPPGGGAEPLPAFVRERAAGAESKLTVVRDGKTLELDVTLATRPADDETTGQGSQDGQGQTPGQDGQGQLPGQGVVGGEPGRRGSAAAASGAARSSNRASHRIGTP
mgnify:CR=1 FL=1